MGETFTANIKADQMSKLKLVSEVPTENQIKRAIISYLLYKGCLVLRVNSGAAKGQYKDRRGNVKERFMRFTQWFTSGLTFKEGQAGVADILAIHNGLPVAIETKRPGNTPTPAQQRFLDEWTAHGGVSIVAQSVEDVQKVLE